MKIKRAGNVIAFTAHVVTDVYCRSFNKEQTPLASLRCQPTVSRWFFRCLQAHLLRSLSILKLCQIHTTETFADDGQSPPVERESIPAPEFVWHGRTSSRRRCFISHSHNPTYRNSPFVAATRPVQSNKKTLLTFGKQGWREILILSLDPAYLQSIRFNDFRTLSVRCRG